MAFKNSNVKDTYLLTTEVENLYINESMIDAPSDYVKVYLYSLYASNYNKDATIHTISSILKMDISEIDKALTYWEELGLLKKISNGNDRYDYDIMFVSQRDLLYGNVVEQKIEVNELIDLSLKDIFDFLEAKLRRPLSSKEVEEVKDWKLELKQNKDVIVKAIEYCIENGKENVNYMSKVLLTWTKLNLKTVEEIEEHIISVSERQNDYKKILKSLGLNRYATDMEKELIDNWFDNLGFNMERIMEACSKTISTSNPNLKYVNKILENWAEDARIYNRDVNKKVTVSVKTVNEYLAYLREKASLERENRKKEVYNKVPKIAELDIEITSLQREVTSKILKGVDVSGLKKRIDDNQSLRAALLTENNYPIDYLDIKYTCEKCKDTGIDENGIRCSCFNGRFDEAEVWQKKK